MKVYFDKNNWKAAENYLVSHGVSTADNITKYLESEIEKKLKRNGSSHDGFYLLRDGCGFFLSPTSEQMKRPWIDIETENIKQANGEAASFVDLDFWLYA